MKTREFTGSRESGPRKKAYRRPATLSRERLEALAVVCSPPSKPDSLACPVGQPTS